ENPAEYKKLAQERFNCGLVYANENGLTFVHGEEAKKAFAKIEFVKTEQSNTGELKGTPACVGKASGRVRIVNKVSDMEKMETGDVLVSICTFPDLVPAMKKASAIVTDEGGITCHAAIVSRELKTPCVVGTKIATSVFKDGEFVEVDATKGTVKKIG
ncbi:MAG: PEP-utilizing enzyme, partial [Candidatus Micrarchaeota archaeon]